MFKLHHSIAPFINSQSQPSGRFKGHHRFQSPTFISAKIMGSVVQRPWKKGNLVGAWVIFSGATKKKGKNGATEQLSRPSIELQPNTADQSFGGVE